MAITSRDRIRDLVRRTGRRSVEASKAADIVASQFQQIADAATQANPHLATGIEAMREVLAYIETVGAELAALSGHAVEGAALAADHAHELAQIATIAGNLPELERVDESVIGRYTLPERPTEEMVRRIVASLESDVVEAAGGGGVVFELRARRDED